MTTSRTNLYRGALLKTATSYGASPKRGRQHVAASRRSHFPRATQLYCRKSRVVLVLVTVRVLYKDKHSDGVTRKRKWPSPQQLHGCVSYDQILCGMCLCY